MQSRSILRVAVAAFLFCAPALAFVAEPVAAVNGDWTQELPPIGQALANGGGLALATGGDLLGILYKGATDNKVGFMLRNADGTYTLKNADLSGAAATTYSNLDLLHATGSTWYASVHDTTGTALRIFRTTDDGATWAATTYGTAGPSSGSYQLLPYGAGISVLWCEQGGANKYAYSTPDGTAVAATHNIGDNKGAPGATGTATFLPTPCGNSVAGYNTIHGTQAFMAGTGIYSGSLFAVQGTSFWTVPASDGTMEKSDATTPCTNPPESQCYETPKDGATTQALPYCSITASNFPSHMQTAGNVVYFQESATLNIKALSVAGGTLPDRYLVTPGQVCDSGAAINASCTTKLVAQNHIHVASNGDDSLLAYTCSSPSRFTVLFSGATSYETASPPTTWDVAMTQAHSYVLFGDPNVGGRPTLLWMENPTTDFTVPVPNLKGFAVDSFDGLAVVRTSDGVNFAVKTFEPTTMTQFASEMSTCNSVDRVMSYHREGGSLYAGYLDCSDAACSAGDAGMCFKIRNQLLDDPDQSNSLCGVEGDFCDFDLENWGITGASCLGNSQSNAFPGDASQIETMHDIPIDWSHGREEGNDRAYVGFAYLNEVDGRAGIFALMQRNNDEDMSCLLEVPFTAPGSTASICTWADLDTGQAYMAGAAQAAGSRVWRVSVEGTELADITIATHKTFSAPLDRLNGAACSGRSNTLLALTTTGSISRVQPIEAASPVRWTITGAALQSLGIAMSADELWFAYLTDDNLVIGNMTDGSTRTTYPRPDGTFHSLWMNDVGGLVYYVTSGATGGVTVFDVHDATTVVSVPNGARAEDADGNPIPATPENCANQDNTCFDVGPGVTAPGGEEGSGGGPNTLFPDPTPAQIRTFGSAENVQLFRALLFLVCGAGVAIAGAWAVGASAGLIFLSGVAGGGIATIAGKVFGVVPVWFLSLVIVGIVGCIIGFFALRRR